MYSIRWSNNRVTGDLPSIMSIALMLNKSDWPFSVFDQFGFEMSQNQVSTEFMVPWMKCWKEKEQP